MAKFQKGCSGNPAGRTPGNADRRTKLRQLLEPHAQDLVAKLVEMAKAGEPTAMRLVIERLIPRIKPDNGINFELPEGRIDTSENMLQIANDVTQAVASGQMTIEEAEKFTEFLKHQRWLVDEAERKKESEISNAKWKDDWEKRLKSRQNNSD